MWHREECSAVKDPRSRGHPAPVGRVLPARSVAHGNTNTSRDGTPFPSDPTQQAENAPRQAATGCRGTQVQTAAITCRRSSDNRRQPISQVRRGSSGRRSRYESAEASPLPFASSIPCAAIPSIASPLVDSRPTAPYPSAADARVLSAQLHRRVVSQLGHYSNARLTQWSS